MTRFLDSLASTLAGMLIATLMLAIAAPQAFVWSSAPRPAQLVIRAPGETPADRTHRDPERISPLTSPDDAGRTGQPDSHPGAPTASPVPGRITPSPTVAGSSPKPVRKPETAASLSGIASFMAPSYGAGYLALPDGPGHRVTICGPAACVVRTSTDAGPDRAMQRAGRVADLSFADFARVCGCNPWIVGLVRVEVSR